MILLIYFLFIVMSVSFPKSKLLTVSIFLFIWILWGWNTWNGDFDAYKLIYDSSINPSLSNVVTEAGFNYFNKIFNLLGFSFEQYMQIISFLVLSIYFIFIIKYCPYPSICAIIIVIIFVMEYVYTRTYIAHSLLLFAFLLSFCKIKYHKLLFVIIILLASLIHRTAFLFLGFYFILDRNSVLHIPRFLFAVFSAVILSIFLFGNFVIPLLGTDFMNKFSAYETSGGFTMISYAHILIVFLTVYVIKLLIDSEKIDVPTRRILIYVANFNLLSLFYLALYYHVPYFGRFVRLLITIDVIFILYSIRFFIQTDNTLNALKSKFVLFAIMVAVFSMLFKSTLSLTYYPLLKKNSVFGEEYYVPEFETKE